MYRQEHTTTSRRQVIIRSAGAGQARTLLKEARSHQDLPGPRCDKLLLELELCMI